MPPQTNFSRPNEAAFICTGCGSSQWLLSEAAPAKEALNGGASAVGFASWGGEVERLEIE